MKNKLEAALKSKVEGFMGNGYNPLLQKPTRLEPVNPKYPTGWGSYIYFGPPPDFGGSYGAYEDNQGRKQVGVKSTKAYSIYDGAPISCRSELSADEREILLTQLDEASETHKCQHCRSQLVLSAGSSLNVENLHCPFCASPLDGAMEKVKKCISKIEEINMSKKVQVKAEADVAKQAMAMPAPAEMNKDSNAVYKDAAKMPSPNEIAQENFTMPKDAVPLEPSAKGVVKEGEIEVKEVKASITPARQARVKRALAAIALEKQKRAEVIKAKTEKAKPAAPVAKPVTSGLNLSAEDTAKLTRELRVLAAKDPKKFEAVKKHKALASLCTEVEAKLIPKAKRIAALAELKVLAETEPEKALALEEQLMFEAPEILVEKESEIVDPVAPVDPVALDGAPAAAPEVTPDPNFVCVPADQVAPAAPAVEELPAVEIPPEAPLAEDAQPLEPEENVSESMEVEFLESNVQDMVADEVAMTLHASTSKNPFWNVAVNGNPVARIYLQSQENPEAVRASFVEPSYAQHFGQAMQQVGVAKMLSTVKANLFAHKVDQAESMKRVEAKVREEVKAEFAEKMSTIRADIMDAIATAMVASDKNFYGAETNANVLKGEIFNNVVAAGVDFDRAVEIVSSSFTKAPEYFDFIISKAVEIMDMSKDSRETFTRTVASSGTLDLAVEKEPKMSDLVKASTGTTKEEVKAQIRKGLKRN